MRNYLHKSDSIIMSKDYYQILGVSKSATDSDVKSAFRKLAREHHPDKGGDAEKFKQINEAYQVLSDSQKRQQYDQFGTIFEGMGGMGGDPFSGFGGFNQGDYNINVEDLGDVFGDFFGEAFGVGNRRATRARRRGADIHIEVEVNFRDAIFGAEREVEIYKNISCSACGGSGAEGRKMSACLRCNGRGEVRERKKTLFGTIQVVSACPACHGRGEEPQIKCKDCLGLGITKQLRKLVVSIPSGTEDGDMLRLRAEGEAAIRGVAGDLYLKIKVRADSEFRRRGNDIISKISVSFPQAALGANLKVRTLDGERDLKIPAGIQSGEILIIRGLGVPHNRGRGDQLIEIIVRTPTKLTKKQKEALEQLLKDI